MALTVEITGGEHIDQGDQVTLAATVEDANGNTPPGVLQYAWSASRGSFIGETDAATAVYHADFTDADDVDVTITCTVTRPANAAPTVSSGSLTAMAALGITGRILNIFINPTADTTENARSNIHPGGTIAAGSDTALASNINITQLEWNDNTNRFIMTGSGGGNIGTFFSGNTAQSVYIIFSDGTVLELDSTLIAVMTSSRVQWSVTDTTFQQKFVDLDGVKSLLVGVGDADAIGWEADTGSDTETFTAAAAEGFTVNITGTTEIEQNQQTTLTAAVTDSDGNPIASGLTYVWGADRGTFIGDTDAASVVYHADFTDTGDIDVTITCSVSRAASETPTSSGAALTAMTEIGITGQILNMYLNPAGAVSPNANNNIYQSGSVGTLAADSDAALASNITINRIRWNNSANRFILNSSGGGNLNSFWSGNTSQSIFLIFEGGAYIELPNSAFVLGGSTWAQFNITDTDIQALLNTFDGTDDLLVGVGDTGSIGIDAGAGSGTATVTAAIPVPLSIEAIDEQFIVVGTADYDLVIDIGGNPDTAKATGHMEGFGQDWDALNGQLHIKSQEVTRLINGVNWDIELVKDVQTLMGQVAYNVVEAAPIFDALGTIHLYRGVPITFDIIIQNIPPLLIPDAELLGLKSELVEYGVKVAGEISATDTLAFSTGTVTIIVPSEGEGADTTYNYPYIIETGSPPQILAPVFTPKGRYGELEFADVTHALGYEWTLAEGADATWTVFDSTRQVIDPGDVVVTQGNLEVTLKFPNIAGASSYEYRLESENHTVDWTAFTGTLSSDGFITTIIPDLQEGVEYTLRLRVGSPWQGVPISLTVYGGRLLYTLHDSDGDSFIIEMNTGVIPLWEPGQQIPAAPILRKILLPAEIVDPDKVFVEGSTVYCSYTDFTPNPDERWVGVFSIRGLSNNSRASMLRKFKLPFSSSGGGPFIYDVLGSEIYIRHGSLSGSVWGGSYTAFMYKVDKATADGATAVASDFWGGDLRNMVSVSVTEDWVYGMRNTPSDHFHSYANVDGNVSTPVPVIDNGEVFSGTARDMRVIGDTAYIRSSLHQIHVVDITKSRDDNANRIRFFNLPVTTRIEGITVVR